MNEDSVIVIDRQEERKHRGALAVILAIAFIALLGIGSTFAYLTWTANQTPNRNTTSELTADLLEPAFTNAALTDNTKDGDGSTVTGATFYTSGDGVGIPKAAASMIPGSTYAKNPFVVNTSKGKGDTMKGYAGIKIQFQKWTPAKIGQDQTKSDGDTGGAWANMTAAEVRTLFKVYHTDINATQIDADNNSTTAAGFTYNKTENTGWQQFANADSEAVAASATGAGDEIAAQTQYANVTADGISIGGAMYFINNKALDSMGTKASDSGTTADTKVSVESNSSATKSTWGYSANSTEASTLPLFEHVTYIKSATTANVQALNKILATTTKTNDGKTFTPGWRMVISGAVVQAWDPSASNGAGAALANDGTSDTGKAVRAALVQALDQATGTEAAPVTSTSEKKKPTAATGLRENSTLGQYVKVTSGTGALTPSTGTGIPEASSVDNSGTEYVND